MKSDNFKPTDKHTWGFMIKHYLSLAAPAVGQNILMLVVWQLNIIYVARLEDSTLVAGIGLATATINMICNSILVGLNGAQETLVS
jgi:Na+-driven multidrug efflux pump